MKWTDRFRNWWRGPQNTTLRDPDEWFREWLTGGVSTSGLSVTQHTALKCAVVFACVRNIADDEAKLPLILYQRLPEGGKERATTNPLYGILHDAPNREMTSFTFRRSVTKDAALCGNGFAEIIRNAAGVVQEMHYIESWRVTPDRDGDGNLFYKVYNGPQPAAKLRRDQMLHIQGLGDGNVGYTTFKIAGDAIGACMAADKYSGSFFSNDATPSFFLKHPQKLSPEAYKNLKDSWDIAHRGVDNAHKVGILEENMEVLKLSIDPNVAQMVESRQYGVEDICRYFRMPPHKVQHLLRSTYSNIEQQSLEYVQDTLMSWLVCWEQELWFKCVPMSRRADLWAEHLVDGLQRGDLTARSTFNREMFNIGASNANEARARENWNPVAGGEIFWVNATMVPADKHAENAELKNEQLRAQIELTKAQTEAAKNPPQTAPAKEQQPANITASVDISAQQAEAARLASQSVALIETYTTKLAELTARNIDAAMPAVRDVLAEKFEKALSTEAYHVEKLSKKPDALNKVVEFYSGHQDKLESSLTTTVTVAAHCLWMALGKGAICSTLDGAVKDHVTKMTARHVARSKAKQDFSPERAVQDAKAEADSLLELVANYQGANQ